MKAVLLLVLMLVAMGSASAQDFEMNATDFAAALLNQSISGMEQAQAFLMILNKASDSEVENLFQNFWGIVWGGVVLGSINNQVTSMVLEEMLDENNKENLTDYGWPGEHTLYDTVGMAFNIMGSNGDVVFGDAAGNQGLARLLMAQVLLMDNPAQYGYDYDFAAEYAKAMAKTMFAGLQFAMKLLEVIPDAFPNW